MSVKYKKDRKNSDKCSKNPLFISKVNEYFDCESTFTESTYTLDNDNSIDAYINDKSVQYRFQEWIPGRIYSPTTRYKRKNSNKKQKMSEWFKILNNRKNGDPYPELLIWVAVDNLSDMSKIYEFRIINIDALVKKYEEGYYSIIESHNQKSIEDNSTLKDEIVGVWYETDNKDGSSSFLVLEDLTDDVIEFTYSSQ